MQKFLQFKSISKRIPFIFLFFHSRIRSRISLLPSSVFPSPSTYTFSHNYSNEKKRTQYARKTSVFRLGMDFHLPTPTHPLRVKPSGDGTIRYENSRHFQVSSAAARDRYRCISWNRFAFRWFIAGRAWSTGYTHEISLSGPRSDECVTERGSESLLPVAALFLRCKEGEREREREGGENGDWYSLDGILAWTRERSHNLSHGEALTCNLGIKGLFFGDGRIWNDLKVGFERSFLFFFFYRVTRNLEMLEMK